MATVYFCLFYHYPYIYYSQLQWANWYELIQIGKAFASAHRFAHNVICFGYQPWQKLFL